MEYSCYYTSFNIKFKEIFFYQPYTRKIAFHSIWYNGLKNSTNIYSIGFNYIMQTFSFYIDIGNSYLFTQSWTACHTTSVCMSKYSCVTPSSISFHCPKLSVIDNERKTSVPWLSPAWQMLRLFTPTYSLKNLMTAPLHRLLNLSWMSCPMVTSSSFPPWFIIETDKAKWIQ